MSQTCQTGDPQCRSDQTGLMPALATMSRHFGTSSSMRFRIPPGPLAMTSKPLLRNCSAMAGVFRTSIDLLDSSSTMAGEVFAGARKPWNVSEIKSFVAEFDHGRHVGQIEPAMDAGDGKRLQGAGFDMRARRRQRREGDLRGAAEDRLDGRPRAGERHMRHLDPADDPEKFAGKMRRRADTGARIIELVGIGLGTCDQLGNRIHAELGIDQDHIWRSCELGNRREIRVRVVRNFGVKTGIDDVGARGDQQRMAVRFGERHSADPDIAAGSRLVLDDHGAANGIAEVRNQNTRHDVGRSGGGEWHDDLDGAFGIARRLCPRRPEAGRHGGAHQDTGGP